MTREAELQQRQVTRDPMFDTFDQFSEAELQQRHVEQASPDGLYNKSNYYSKCCLTLLIRITINAVTVMVAVITLFPKFINAVIVRPVKMYQNIAYHVLMSLSFLVVDLTFFG